MDSLVKSVDSTAALVEILIEMENVSRQLQRELEDYEEMKGPKEALKNEIIEHLEGMSIIIEGLGIQFEKLQEMYAILKNDVITLKEELER